MTIKSLADRLGLSVTTVSRVMNGMGEQYRISKKTIESVIKAADTLGYAPNKIAKGLRSQKTSIIGLIVPDISNSWFAKITEKIGGYATKMGYDILLCNSENSTKVEIKNLERLQNWNVDGVIMAPIGLESSHIINLVEKGFPIVLVDRFFEQEHIPCLSADNFGGAYTATEHMIKNGHVKIACIQGLVGTSTNTQRVNGYKKALLDNNIPFDKSLVLGNRFSFKNGYLQASRLVNDNNDCKVTAIFSANNSITLGILKFFKERKIKLPDQVSIVSHDDEIFSDLLYTPISTVSHLHVPLLGKMAFDFLFNRDASLSEKKVYRFPTKFIERGSVKKING